MLTYCAKISIMPNACVNTKGKGRIIASAIGVFHPENIIGITNNILPRIKGRLR